MRLLVLMTLSIFDGNSFLISQTSTLLLSMQDSPKCSSPYSEGLFQYERKSLFLKAFLFKRLKLKIWKPEDFQTVFCLSTTPHPERIKQKLIFFPNKKKWNEKCRNKLTYEVKSKEYLRHYVPILNSKYMISIISHYRNAN